MPFVNGERLMRIALAPDTEARLREKAEREGRDVESIANRLLVQALDMDAAPPPSADGGSRPGARPSGTVTPLSEAELIERINEGPSPETWERYHALVEQRRDERLTSEEHAE